MASRSIICRSRSLRQIIDQRDTDKSRLFAIMSSIITVLSFHYQVCFHIFKTHSDSSGKQCVIFTPRMCYKKLSYQKTYLQQTTLAVFTPKSHYPSGRTWANICSSSGYACLVYRRAQDICVQTNISLIVSFKRHFEGQFVQMHNASCAHLYIYQRGITRQATDVCPHLSRWIMCLQYKNGEDAFWMENASSSIKTAIQTV